ncbi:copper chaperone PCu(A)C [Acetobacteraceae bacterium ESL0709]|nr:copper chaperone PCu(A)C [Acetobacteraceae bacterium ESL0697]MDF7678037.1 copper chaperone PCu(A)C [Acetobacteraceae bacterium ESL0709]
MKKTFHYPALTLTASLIITVFSPAALADASKSDGSAQNIIVKDGVLVPFTNNPSMAQGFFIIENKSPKDMLLQGISAPSCNHISANHSDDVQLSDQTGGDDIFKHLAIPHESVMVFPKEGYHLICYGFKLLPTKQGNSPFTFHFREGPDVTTNFTFKNKSK